MPVFNGELFIRKAIDSLLAQTFSDFELIISDNASTDSTSEICKEYEKKDSRIRYIRQSKNMGAYWNFYFVLKQAKYDYFLWASADDYWHPDFLKKNIEILLSKKNVVCSISKVQPYKLDNTNLNRPTNSVKYPSFIQGFVKKRRHAMISVTFP
ncbi:MAG: glycosyltransferase family 2 protein, partial [Nitrosopumilaceae archaeon]